VAMQRVTSNVALPAPVSATSRVKRIMQELRSGAKRRGAPQSDDM
jgi:hypothetical protein